MVIWKAASCSNVFLSMTSTSEAVLDIAGMRAELSVAISVDSELFTASRASIGVICLSFYQVQMAVPPSIPASIRAEAFPLPSGILCNGPAALLTKGICRRCGQAVPSAEGLHRVDGYT